MMPLSIYCANLYDNSTCIQGRRSKANCPHVEPGLWRECSPWGVFLNIHSGRYKGFFLKNRNFSSGFYFFFGNKRVFLQHGITFSENMKKYNRDKILQSKIKKYLIKYGFLTAKSLISQALNNEEF